MASPSIPARLIRITLTAPLLEGGIGRVLVNLADSWCERGVEVDLILDHRREALMPEIHPKVTVFESKGSHPVFKAPWLAHYLRRRVPTGILTAVPRHTVWALHARRISGLPVSVVTNVHNNYLHALEAVRPNKRRRRVALLQRYYPRCEAIVPVSRGAAKAFSQLTGIPEEKLSPIPNPVVTSMLVQKANEPVAHPWFNDSIPIVIWVGRLEYQKNVDLLIDAFDRVRPTVACRLAIVGAGSETAKLVGRINASPYWDDIVLLGHQDNPYRFIRRSAVLALCSRWEGFGNVLVEAMALGTPVVSTDCPSGPAEILDEGSFGPLVPVGDADALASAIQQCLHHPTPAATLIAAAQRYRSDLIADRYLKLFTAGRVLNP